MEPTKAQLQKTSSLEGTGSKKVIDNLFATIKLTYPLFLKKEIAEYETKEDQNNYIRAVKRLWARHLFGFSQSAIEKAVDLMIDKNLAFPPKLPEFKGLAREANKSDPSKQVTYDNFCNSCRSLKISRIHHEECLGEK